MYCTIEKHTNQKHTDHSVYQPSVKVRVKKYSYLLQANLKTLESQTGILWDDHKTRQT